MSDNHKKLVEFLSPGRKLSTRNSRKELQSALEEAGYTANASAYPAPDGKIGVLTSRDIVGFIKDNPATLMQLSPELYQRLSDEGYRDELREIVNNSPVLQEDLLLQAKALIGDGSVNDLNRTSNLKAWQSISSLLGDYNGKVDGIAGRGSRRAENTLSHKFNVAFAGDSTPKPNSDASPEIRAVQTFRVLPDGTMVPSDKSADMAAAPKAPVNAAATRVDHYMTALGFTDRGFKKGDGGERDWSKKRDDEVWSVQVLLNRSGANLAIDGQYGGGTEKAVKAFQREHGLPVTGQADVTTLKTLLALPESQPTFEGQDSPRMYTMLENRKIITDILPQVEKDTGVSGEYLRAVWAKETHFGVDMSSGTGSEGPFQITGRTFRGLINKYGDEIAGNLRAQGKDGLADRVLAAQAGNVDGNLRYDPYVATYSAAYYTKETGVDTAKNANWGAAYAIYNIGAGGFSVLNRNRETPNVGALIDAKYPRSRPASNNPYFFRGRATGEVVFGRYQSELEQSLSTYGAMVQSQLNAYEVMEPLKNEASGDVTVSHNDAAISEAMQPRIVPVQRILMDSGL